MKKFGVLALAAMCLGLAPGCSGAAETPERQAGSSSSTGGEAQAMTTRAAPRAPARTERAGATADEAGSRVLGRRDFTLRGKPACEIRFIYAGRQAENLFWEEPCAAVTARMLTRRELEALGRWGRMDDFARKFTETLPGGKVLYVEGAFSASVYPVGTTGSTYEVPVAD